MAAHRSRQHGVHALEGPHIGWCCLIRCRRPSQPRCWDSRRSRGARACRQGCSCRAAMLVRWCPGHRHWWQLKTCSGSSGSRRRGRCGAARAGGVGGVSSILALCKGSLLAWHRCLLAGLQLHTTLIPLAVRCALRRPPQEQLKQQHALRRLQRYEPRYDHEQPLPGAPGWACMSGCWGAACCASRPRVHCWTVCTQLPTPCQSALSRRRPECSGHGGRPHAGQQRRHQNRGAAAEGG